MVGKSKKQGNLISFTESDRRQMLMKLSKSRLVDYIEMINKNWWSLQNHYIAEIEKRYGLDVAMDFDRTCFTRAYEAQIHRMRKLFKFGDDIQGFMNFNDFSQAAANLEYEYRDITPTSILWRVTKCPMQERRLKDGQPEATCKEGAIYTNSVMARLINPKMKALCRFCPPDAHPKDAWCEFEFKIEP
jgi:hypothetical protein